MALRRGVWVVLVLILVAVVVSVAGLLFAFLLVAREPQVSGNSTLMLRWDYLNAQEQRKIVWPPSFAKARAYLDQLERGSGLVAASIAFRRCNRVCTPSKSSCR